MVRRPPALWVSHAVMKQIVAEADDKFPRETGGVLIGYQADNGEYVVRACTGPGKGASHKRFWFKPDHEWQCEQLDRIYAESCGELVYLGDWHTHPRGVPAMSYLDMRTLSRIARHDEVRLKCPLMMIGGGRPGKWKWAAHEFTSRGLCGLLSNTKLRSISFF